MKKIALLPLLVLTLCAHVSAQDRNASLGFKTEYGVNPFNDFSGGAVMGGFVFSYNLPGSIAVGGTAAGGYDFSGVVVIEPSVLVRWYFLDKDGGHTGFFLQADEGALLFLEDGKLSVKFLYGICGGYRLIAREAFYFDPYVRVGYPFVISTGAAVGVRF